MMKKMLFFCLIISVGLFMAASPALSASFDDAAQKIEDAYISKNPAPLSSLAIEGLTTDQAYEIQKKLVEIRVNKGEEIVGYKAGLTSAPSQKKFGVTEAVRGTLFKSMIQWPGTMYQKNFARMFIETEIGFRFGKDITEPVEDIESLKKAVAIVFPAIELPDLSFTDMKQIKGPDIIAANVVARKVLVGDAVWVKDVNSISVKLFHNGREIACGVGENALGDQWEALKWVVNNVLSKGGEVKEGYTIITGCISKLLPAKPGTYVADYGDFGKIEFEFK
jgi:2-keto-4-pentenoate hydratase